MADSGAERNSCVDPDFLQQILRTSRGCMPLGNQTANRKDVNTDVERLSEQYTEQIRIASKPTEPRARQTTTG